MIRPTDWDMLSGETGGMGGRGGSVSRVAGSCLQKLVSLRTSHVQQHHFTAKGKRLLEKEEAMPLYLSVLTLTKVRVCVMKTCAIQYVLSGT